MTKNDINVKIDLFKEYLTMQEKSSATISKYVRDAGKFFSFLDRNDCKSQITKKDVMDYKRYLVSRYKPASVNTYLTAINSYFYWRGAKGLIVKNIRIQRSYSIGSIFAYNEYLGLLETAKRLRRFRAYYLMRALASTGMRVSELQYLTVAALSRGSLYIFNKAKAREILLPETLRAELCEYCGKTGIERGVIFHGRNADVMLDKSCIWRDLKIIAEESGIDPRKVHAHSFRHFFAKEFIAHYHDVVDLADILGHNSIETTRIYTRTSPQEKLQRLNALGL